MRRFDLSLAVILTTPLAVAAPPSGATAAPEAPDPNSTKNVQAREAFELGSALAKQGQWADALAAFQRSARLWPHPATDFNIGYVERALGHLTRARKALRRAVQGGLDEDKTAEAESYLREIESRLVTVTVTVATPDTAILVDGRPIEPTSDAAGSPQVAGTRDPAPAEPTPASRFELRLDPGQHTIVASRPGGRDLVVRRSFAPGETAALELDVPPPPRKPAERPLADRPPTSPSPNAASARAVPPDTADAPGEPLRWPAWIGFSVGGAGLALGTVAGIVALDQKGELDGACGADRDACPPTEDNARRLDAFGTTADLATVGFAVAGAGAAFGTLWLVLLPTSGEQSTVRPVLAPGFGGVRGAF